MPRVRPVLVVIAVLPLLLAAVGRFAHVSDFGCYWCGAKINLAGGNPYTQAEVLALERTIEPERQAPQMPWGPPWALAVVAPLAVIDFPTARLIWLVVEGLLIGLAVGALWTAYRGPESRLLDALFLGFSFYPTLLLLGLGQVSVTNLLALAGFVHFLGRGAPFRAGLAASLIAVKPQVMLLFALALVAWIIWHRRWGVLAGGAVGVTLLSAAVLIPNPHVFAQYVTAMTEEGPVGFAPPTPGTLLRVLAGGAFWPSLIPLGLGVVWLGWRFARSWRAWDWRLQLPVLAFACFLSSPYAWAYDLVILLVPLTQAAALANAGGRNVRLAFWAAHLLLSGLALAMSLCRCDESEFMWLAPALLALYCWSTRGVGDSSRFISPTGPHPHRRVEHADAAAEGVRQPHGASLEQGAAPGQSSCLREAEGDAPRARLF